MSVYDSGVIAFYFVFMLAMGWLVSRFVRNSSDYFRGGGQMLWWLVGSSAFMTQFSAWTFTGAASKAYSEGWPIFVIFFGNALGFVFNALYFGARSRQMRVVTVLEAVRERFSKVNEQVFTWLQIPLGTLYAGIWLNGLGVFLTAAFGFDLELTIIVTGAVVVAMTLVGGSWAAIAGDFIQVLILMPVTVVAAVFALREVGGVGAFLEKLPAGHLDVGSMFDSPIMLLWVGAIVVKQYISANNLFDASRYLCVKDGRHARRAALMAALLFVVGPVVWFTTPMAARILHPDLSAVFPGLRNPAEGAFFATCLVTLPAGMIGLLISGILAATMSSMDSGLNRNAGIFVRNFYLPVLRPSASDREMVLTGKIATGAMGVLVIVAGLNFSRLENVGLFELMLTFGSLVAVPYTVPLTLCMFVKRTPPWSGWTTVIVCLVASFVSARYLDADWVARTFDLAAPLSVTEAGYWTVASGLALNLTVGCLWFFGSMRFWNRVAPADRARIEAFYTRMCTPVDFAKEEGPGNDVQQGQTLGFLCLCYGGFICLLAAIPNPLPGRIAFLFCGGVVVAIGLGLRHAARRNPVPANAVLAKGTSVP